MGTSARMHSSGFIPLNFQSYAEFYLCNFSKSQRSHADKLERGGISVQRT